MYSFDAKNAIDEIVEFLNEYKNNGCKGVVLGLSGGKDSTVVAMLAKKVFGDNVMAILMPNGNQVDIDDSINIAKTLNLDWKIVNIETIYNNLLHSAECKITDVPRPLHDGNLVYERDFIQNCPHITDKAKTNIPPRIRMTILYAVAQSVGYRVIGTGNLSESYIGWCTKWGDCANDVNPIGHLTCSEVIEIGKVLAEEFGLDTKYIVKTPADGLSGKSDEDNFGFSYETLDSYLRGNPIPTDAINKIEQMHNVSIHKTKMPLKVRNY